MPASRLAPYRAALEAARDTILAVDARARPEHARWLGEGWSAVAVRVPSAAGDWVVRIPRPAAWWAMRDLEKDARLLPLLGRQPFQVAIPRDVILIRNVDGTSCGTAHRFVPGAPLRARGVPRKARAALCAQLGEFLAILHATPVDQAKRSGAKEIDLWRDQYVSLVEETLSALSPGARAWLERVADDFERRGGSADAPRVLIHADLSGDHLLVDDRGALSGVIDFSDAVVADPALDFAGILNDLGWRDLERVWAHYTGEVDEGAIARTQFYIAVAPIFQVVYGEAGAGPEERLKGIRRLAARAAAASRTVSR